MNYEVAFTLDTSNGFVFDYTVVENAHSAKEAQQTAETYMRGRYDTKSLQCVSVTPVDIPL